MAIKGFPPLCENDRVNAINFQRQARKFSLWSEKQAKLVKFGRPVAVNSIYVFVQ